MSAKGGQRRIVSVLVADVAGSTAIGERLGPERSKALFDEVARLMGDEVRRLEGTVAQLTGDGLFALFGAPTAHEDDPERAVRAALAIQQRIGAYARELEEAYGVELAARVAVNTGPIVLPDGEGPDHERYNALGDTVTVAARLQDSAGPGGVAVGEETARQVASRFELEPLGPLALKGKSQAVEAFRVVGEAVTARSERPLVGRERELSQLLDALGALAEGRGAVVAIAGEPGIGKSRLVAEARATLGEVRFLEASAVEYARGTPYAPVRDLLRSWLGVGVTDPEARIRLELRAELARLGLDTYPFLGNVLGLALEPDADEQLRSFARDSVRRQTHDAVADVLRALARERPLCIVLDDLQWADEPTLLLAEELLALVEAEAVAFVIVHRADPEQLSWALVDGARRRYRHLFREFALEPLALAECAELAAGAAGAPLPEEIAALLAERAGGNPFFLEEALRDLLERGVLRRINAHVEVAEGAEAAVPALVQEALQARLDRLAPETRELVSVAAVTGRTFGLPLLERMLPHESLLSSLSELQRLDLVVEERRRPAPEYRFRHGLVQEAAYAGLTSAGKRALHRRVAEALEELAHEAPEQAYPDLARHYGEADEPAKAADYLLKAGDAARTVWAEDEAIAHYRRAVLALREIGESGRARDTLFRVALLHHLAFDFEGANGAWAEAFDLPEPPPVRLDPTETLRQASLLGVQTVLAPGHTYISGAIWQVANLFRGLLKLRQLDVLPSLAERIEVSGDGTRYRFALRRDHVWSDGVPVTAGDFAWTFDVMRERQVKTAHLLHGIEAAALDERTLELSLPEPQPWLPFVLATEAYSAPWPRHVVDRFGDEWLEPGRAAYSGPYVLEPGGASVASPTWRGSRGNVGRLELQLEVDSLDEIVSGWVDGTADFGDAIASNAWLDRIVAAPETRHAPQHSLSTSYLAFRDAPPLDDVRMRRALAHALDTRRIYEAISGTPGAGALGGMLPPAMPGHSHELALPYDATRARELLAEAGYADGLGLPELDLVVVLPSAHPTLRQVVDAFSSVYAEVGVRVSVRTAAPWEFSPDDARDLWFFAWSADYPDPLGFLGALLDSEWRRGIGCEADWRPELERARALRDRPVRLEAFRALDALLVRELAVFAPIHYMEWAVYWRPWIEGMWVSPLGWATLDELVVRR